MDSSRRPPTRPPNLSSSVSMFIEDSRVTAVANADVNPRNPGCFYTISTHSYSPNVSVQSPFQAQNQNWSFSQRGGNVERDLDPDDHYVQHQQQPHEAVTYGSASSNVAADANPFYRRSSSQPPPRNSRPREIIHKIIRESSQEDAEEDQQYQNQQKYSSASANRPRQELPSSSSPSSHNSFSSNIPTKVNVDRSITFSSDNRNPKPRFRTATLNIEPVVPFINVKESIPSTRLRDNRTYTSVNLTLRSPSAGSENKRFSPTTASASVNVNSTVADISTSIPPLCACGGSVRAHGNPNNTMTYSTYSNSRDGFEAQVQIQIGPNGGTISASRRRKENVVLQQMNADLTSAQAERKDKLVASLSAEKNVLAQLQQEIAHLRSKLHPLFNDLEKLKDENQRLRIECQLMTREVDLYDNGTVPLGETSEEFYRDINPGQDANALFGSTNNRRRLQGVEPGGPYPYPLSPQKHQPPPRPPPPKYLPLPREDGPTGEWSCSMCTFQNHPDLTQCEQCGMVRVASREQNIRIRVVRHQPPHHRKVIHSWVV